MSPTGSATIAQAVPMDCVRGLDGGVYPRVKGTWTRRHFALLEAMKQAPAASLRALSQATAIPLATVHKMKKELVEAGLWIEEERSRLRTIRTLEHVEQHERDQHAEQGGNDE